MRDETSDSSRDVHRAIASVPDLHVEGEQFVFPDVRLEVEDAHGVSAMPWLLERKPDTGATSSW
jgi:hypothetical protein